MIQYILKNYDVSDVLCFIYLLGAGLFFIQLSLSVYLYGVEKILRSTLPVMLCVMMGSILLKDFVAEAIKPNFSKIEFNAFTKNVYIKNPKYENKNVGKVKFENNEREWEYLGKVDCGSLSTQECVNELKKHEDLIVQNKSLDVMVANIKE